MANIDRQPWQRLLSDIANSGNNDETSSIPIIQCEYNEQDNKTYLITTASELAEIIDNYSLCFCKNEYTISGIKYVDIYFINSYAYEAESHTYKFRSFRQSSGLNDDNFISEYDWDALSDDANPNAFI